MAAFNTFTEYITECVFDAYKLLLHFNHGSVWFIFLSKWHVTITWKDEYSFTLAGKLQSI